MPKIQKITVIEKREVFSVFSICVYVGSEAVILKTERGFVMKKKHRILEVNRRLERAMFDNPAASVNEATGFSNTLPENGFESESLSELLNVRTSVLSGKKDVHERKSKDPNK